ncbi:MAG TPA: CbiX/SirB N-terminal domain-containing protein [Humibacter sp.]|nr:CbiX/SirB N-terminal domain-containing protein [Humibacter sp.]
MNGSPADIAPAEPALLAVSHGTSSQQGRSAVSALVEAVRAARPELEVRPGFVDVQRPDVADLLTALPAGRRAVVAPLLLSAGYHVRVDLARELEPTAGRVALGSALGPDGRLIEVLGRRLEAVGLAASDAVVLAAAGSSDSRAVEDCRETGRMLSAALGRQVMVGFLAAAEPGLRDAVAAARTEGSRVVVCSYLLAPGYFQDLTEASGADVVTSPLLLPHDTPPELVDIVLERYAAAVLDRF